MRAKRIIVFPSDLQGVCYYRISNPIKVLQKHIDVTINIAFDILKIYKWLDRKFDLLVTHRQYMDWQRDFYKNLNIPYIVDTDDLLWVDNPLSPFKLDERQIRVHDGILKGAKKLIASTPVLRDEINHRVDRNDAIVLPNLIEKRFFSPPTIKMRSKLRILWAGSQTHYNDLKPFFGMIKKSWQQYQFVFVGYVPEELRPYVELHPWKDTEDYVPYLKSLDCDVGFIPLDNNRFNRSKSHIKMLEFSAIGLPCITSNVEPYKENPNGTIHYELLDVLSKLDNPIVRKQWAEKNYEWAQKYVLEDWEEFILDTWTTI